MARSEKDSVQRISVIVPKNPFVPAELRDVAHCLAALDVRKLMQWWPGQPHAPHRNPAKVKAIQRSLDWKRVTQIAAYLLQKEIVDAPDQLDEFFRDVYEPKSLEPGRQWPPRVPRVIGFQRSSYPTFSNVLLHVNGAKVGRYPDAALRPRSKYSVASESEEALDELLDCVAWSGATAILTFPDHACSNGLSGAAVKEIASEYFRVHEKSVTSKFSTLGGAGTSTSEGRAARLHAAELILLLQPK